MQIDYLPTSFALDCDYESLYVDSCDGFGLDSEETPIVIHPGMTEHEVYRLLPTAESFEFGGVIEPDKIRFQRCDPVMAWTEFSADCSWHSHPTRASACDQPSPMDIRSFLVNRNLRAVTAGRDIIWVFDKQPETIPFVKRLLAWEQTNLLNRMKHWMGLPNGMQNYILEALSILSIDNFLEKKASCDDWVPVIESLGIKVRIFHR
jgi:hypothetical protein